MANLQLTLTGQQGLDVVSQTALYLSSDPQTAEQYLGTIKKNIPVLLTKLKDTERERERERDALLKEEEYLMRAMGDKERQMSSFKNQIGTCEVDKARQNALLGSATSALARANKERKSAKVGEGVAIGTTVASGVGAVVLGILCPPSLIATVPLLVTTGTLSITAAEEMIDECNTNIRAAEESVRDIDRRIALINQSILGIEREISNLASKKGALHAEMGKMRKTIVFFQKAATFLGKLIETVRGGRNETDLLHTIVAEANRQEEYEILKSDGCTVIVNSFAAAWKEVEKKVANGENIGFLSIGSA